MKRLLPALLLSIIAADALRAALPDAVRQACFSAAVTERTTGSSWGVSSWETWRGNPMRIREVGEDTIAEQDGTASPAGWATTTVSLLMPRQTEANPQPTQRLTVTVTPTEAIPEKAVFDILLLKDAPLPPCSVKPWGNRIAIVSDASDWYLAADDSKARVSVQEGADRKTTVKLEGLSPKGKAPVSATLLVGEGPLPTPPPSDAKPQARKAP